MIGYAIRRKAIRLDKNPDLYFSDIHKKNIAIPVR